ncbi:hypothetical protein [Kitasatospora purpeofusca]|uniref:hypothetical protein n=1 Tax=Kitasatospora purpeofusca TaxID=67352 RepID=UPI0035D94112
MTSPPHHPDAPQAPARLTPAQRDGRACVSCGGTDSLKEAGRVVDRGLGFAVKTCRSCRRNGGRG